MNRRTKEKGREFKIHAAFECISELLNRSEALNWWDGVTHIQHEKPHGYWVFRFLPQWVAPRVAPKLILLAVHGGGVTSEVSIHSVRKIFSKKCTQKSNKWANVSFSAQTHFPRR
ncbi:hypothetical protein EGT07_18100 [Herbaspirillum sp. HC18]|nr:hypothetical protein EGT07_18100 [Herbaspirillum sp. HC18]